MMNGKYRFLVPNGITFLSLICGIVSILLSAGGNLVPAGLLILASFVLDLLDGHAARVLKADSAFGLQLDSLVDMVSFGVAPAVLAFKHFDAEGAAMILAWPACIAITLAGAFRLARFNLLPPKESLKQDTVGLTITSGGVSVALAVLSNWAFRLPAAPGILYFMYMMAIAALMVSRVAFPSFFLVFADRRRNIVLIALFAVTMFQFTWFNAWFLWNNVFLGLALLRAGYKSWL
jgi:CDP-diacylglycerol---serine O-phosphatidyltransferase